MIRIRDISMPPEHNTNQLLFEAAKLLRISNSEILQLSIVKRSVDARKKPNVQIIYTVDVRVRGSENKVLKRCGCKRASIAQQPVYRIPKASNPGGDRPVGLDLVRRACSPHWCLRWQGEGRWYWSGERMPEQDMKKWKGSFPKASWM